MQLFQTTLRRAFCLLLFITATAGFVIAQDLSVKLPTDPDVETGVLPNGLTYYIRNNHKPEKKVELRLVVKAGSILEDDKQQGLAHFMEHMNFNGTKNFKRNDLVSYLQSIGVQFGADLNANTGFDQTIFILPIPTDKPGNLEKGFQIIEDWAHNALLTGKDIDEERGVVLEESRLGKGADDRMLKKYFPKLVQGSLYAERLPIGKDEILKTFKYDEIRRFYHDWYRPDLQAVIIVGDIDPATAKKMLMDHFAGLKNPPNEKPRKYVGVKPRTAPDAMVVTDKEATNSVLMLMYPYEKKQQEITMGDYRRDIERNLVLQMLNLRLKDLSQGSNPPFPFAQVGFDDLIQGYESFVTYALFGSDGPKKALDAVTGELLRVKQYGFTKDELEIAEKDYMSNMEKAYNERTTTNSSEYVDEYIRNFTNGEAFPGISNEYAYTKELLPGIKIDKLNAMVKDWTKNNNTFTLVTAPDKKDEKLPTNQELLAMTDKGFHQEIKRTEEKTVAASLMESTPTPGKIVSETKEEGLGATTYTLSNGIQVTVKPTDFKSDEILVTGVKKGGANSYGVADKSNVNFATDLVESMGVGNFSPTDLEKVTAGKKINVDMTIDDINDQIKASSTVNDLKSMFQLMYLYMEQPRKDESLFDAYKTKQKSMLQFLSSNPQVAFIDTTVKTLYNNNPLAKMRVPKPSDFDKLNLDRALDIYHKEFSSADGYHFFIVGNVNNDAIKELIETYLGSLPQINKAPDFKDNGVRPIEGNKRLVFKKGKDKKSLIVAVYTGEMPYSEDMALKANALAEILNIKVIQDLREKMGDIYTGGFSAQMSKYPYPHYSIQLVLPCGPKNVDTLISAANEEIAAIKDNGPDAVDLDKVKNQWREKYRTDVKENNYWTGKLEDILFWGKDKEHVLQYEAWIDKLTPKEIQDAAKKLFTGKNEFISILYPES